MLSTGGRGAPFRPQAGLRSRVCRSATTILLSAIGAGVFAVLRVIHPLAPTHLLALALAGLAGVV